MSQKFVKGDKVRAGSHHYIPGVTSGATGVVLKELIASERYNYADFDYLVKFTMLEHPVRVYTSEIEYTEVSKLARCAEKHNG